MSTKNADKKRRNRGKGRSSQGVLQRYMAPRVTQIPNLGLTHTGRLRFTTTATVAFAVSFQNLMDCFLIATTATQGYQLFDAVRIRAVEVWAFTTSATVTTTVSFAGVTTAGVAGSQQTFSDTSMALEPAYVRAVPSARCPASLFQTTNGNTAFNIYAPAASVVDVHFVYRTGLEGNTPAAAQAALVAATAGLVYLRGLDGLPTATTKFAPQGTPLVI
jgi:hypothetical protein